MLIIAYLLLALWLTATAAALGTYHYLRRPANAAKPPPEHTSKALLALNLQQCYLKQARSPEQQQAIAHINQCAQSAYRRGLCVLFSQQIYQTPGARWMANLFWRGDAVSHTPGLRIDPRVAATGQILAAEPWDLFQQSALQAQLSRNAVGTLLICGFADHASFYHTAASALRLGYRVVLLEEAIISLEAKQWQRLRQRLLDLGAESGPPVPAKS